MVRLALLAILLLCRLSAAERTGVQLLREDDAWLRSATGEEQLANLLTFQTPAGGWCKAFDARRPRDPGDGPDGFGAWHGTPTIDNGATHSEIRLLARAATVSGRPEYRQACLRGLRFLLERQYTNGGWPQRSPLEPGDHGYGVQITCNDHAMAEVLALMHDIADPAHPVFAWVAEEDRRAAAAAFERGIDCLLRCQVVLGGEPTAWCQQHDATTLVPVAARAYELPCLAGSESARIAVLLMRLERPDARIRRAVDAAQRWFLASRITGHRLREQDGDRVLVEDAAAPALWARCYDLDSGRPFFCDRDGVKRWSLAEISRERRTGYAWYGTWGEQVLREHPRWLARVGAAPAP
jgi:PelA/Pel-15E family pectate lyase